MLCQFSFKNFMSYKDETIFDMQAEDLDEFADSVISFEKVSPLLPVSVIYGPNGGGKTNLLKALSCLISIVTKPIQDLDKTRSEMILQQATPCDPFALDPASKNEPTEFNIYFRTKDNEFRYYIAVLNDIIVSEVLHRRTLGGKKTAVIFEREGEQIELGASINKSRVSKDVNPKMPYFSFLAITYNLPVITEAQMWFESCIIRNYANPTVEHSIILSEDEKSKVSFLHALNDMGIDISDYRYDKDQRQIFLERKLNDISYELPFPAESDGTRKLFAALPVLLLSLTEGRLVIIDELDAKLHPKLLRYIISMFTNPNVNKNGAQLLFTSHDMSTMKNDVFRRDEIWFAALNDEHSSEIYSLYEIRREDGKRINATAAYDKQYLEGRYGADPYLRSMLDWEV
ncbi:MAG: AAA family ATPase [Clostridia bacterium]|nr:AAA family ATPase [Clostridia bacterium]